MSNSSSHCSMLPSITPIYSLQYDDVNINSYRYSLSITTFPSQSLSFCVHVLAILSICNVFIFNMVKNDIHWKWIHYRWIRTSTGYPPFFSISIPMLFLSHSIFFTPHPYQYHWWRIHLHSYLSTIIHAIKETWRQCIASREFIYTLTCDPSFILQAIKERWGIT